MANWKEIAFKSDVTDQVRTLNFTNSSFYVKGITKKSGSGGAAGGQYGYMYFTPLGSNSASNPLALTLSSAADASDGDIKNLVDGIDATGSDTSSAYFTLDHNETVTGSSSTQTGWLKGVLNCSMDVPYGDAANKSHHFNISTTVCNETGSSAHASYKTHFSLWRAYLKDADQLPQVNFYKVQDLIRANNADQVIGNQIMYAPSNPSRLRHYRAEPFDVPLNVGSVQDEHTCLYVLGVIFSSSSDQATDGTISNSLGTQDWPADDQAGSIKTQTIVKYVPAPWTAP